MVSTYLSRALSNVRLNPPKNPAWVALLDWGGRAERGREREGDDTGQDDRDDDRDGELLVEGAGDAADEGDRDEDRAENDDDGDQGAAELADGAIGGDACRGVFILPDGFDG